MESLSAANGRWKIGPRYEARFPTSVGNSYVDFRRIQPSRPRAEPNSQIAAGAGSDALKCVLPTVPNAESGLSFSTS